MRKKNIMLVDDDKIFNFLSEKTITSLGLANEIHFALNGRQALELLEEYKRGNVQRPDIIFLDLNMPVMNGYEFIEKLKAVYPDDAPHVIVFTAAGQRGTLYTLQATDLQGQRIDLPLELAQAPALAPVAQQGAQGAAAEQAALHRPDEQHEVGDFHYAQACRGEGVYHAPALWLWELGNQLSGVASVSRTQRLSDLAETPVFATSEQDLETAARAAAGRGARSVAVVDAHGCSGAAIRRRCGGPGDGFRAGRRRYHA